MADQTYGISYKVNDEATPKIAALKGEVVGLAAALDQSKSGLKDWGQSLGSIGKGGAALGKSLDAIKGQTVADLRSIATSLGEIDHASTRAVPALAGMAVALGRFARSADGIGKVASEVWSIANAMTAAEHNAGQLHSGLTGLAGKAASIGDVRARLQQLQRTAYGAARNVDDLGTNLGAIAGKGANLGSPTAGLKGLGAVARSTSKGLGSATVRTGRLGSALDGLMARIAIVHGLRTAITDLGDAIKGARDEADESANKNLDLRDRYRELANLQGKPSADNEVIGGALRFRMATGATDREANDALRRFEGGLEVARQSGHIAGNATSGVAGDFFREATRAGIRAGMSGETSGLLAATIAQNQAVPTADSGLATFQNIIDRLNAGNGDLTPMVKALVAGAGGQVGKGLNFSTLDEYAAAYETASLHATPGTAATRVRQAGTALGRFGERATMLQRARGEAKFGDTLDKLGITPGMPFVERIERLSPLLEGARDPDTALRAAGAGNQAERRALIMLWNDRATLRAETEKSRLRADPARVKQLNDDFMNSPDARRRIGEAQRDAARFAQFQGDEALAAARPGAEAELRRRGEIGGAHNDTEEALLDSAITRLLGVGANFLSGASTNQDELPLFLGGKPARQIKVDREAIRQRVAGGGAAPGFIADDPMATQADRFKAIVGGQGPADNRQLDFALRTMIEEARRTNQHLEDIKRAGGRPPEFMQRMGGPMPQNFAGPDLAGFADNLAMGRGPGPWP